MNAARQLSIFDFMAPEAEIRTLDDIPEEEMVGIVGRATGLDFRFRDSLYKYEAKIGKVVFRVGYSNYSLHDNHDRFISCGWSTKCQGAGGPYGSVESAIKFFKRAIERTKNL